MGIPKQTRLLPNIRLLSMNWQQAPTADCNDTPLIEHGEGELVPTENLRSDVLASLAQEGILQAT